MENTFSMIERNFGDSNRARPMSPLGKRLWQKSFAIKWLWRFTRRTTWGSTQEVEIALESGIPDSKLVEARHEGLILGHGPRFAVNQAQASGLALIFCRG